MIQMESVLDVVDNSGAKKVKCIKVLGGSHHMHAYINDVIVVSVVDAMPNAKIKSGEVYRALIVCTKKGLVRKDGTTVSFSRNAAVLLNKQGEMLGTRVLSPVTRELSELFPKVVSLSKEVV
ncbi:50S ribosomal protein L14 [Candidatus Sarmatiella mevalonica]|uniref:50S ribosomal protein L14 n=1 Tax=Candidatus Sarmatiella mevalonica TaxID=2770581 RepID=UPI0019225433|nr:50S ribosomal protein L14 [Candidatus Sarmatiella mevalonica]